MSVEFNQIFVGRDYWWRDTDRAVTLIAIHPHDCATMIVEDLDHEVFDTSYASCERHDLRMMTGDERRALNAERERDNPPSVPRWYPDDRGWLEYEPGDEIPTGDVLVLLQRERDEKYCELTSIPADYFDWHVRLEYPGSTIVAYTTEGLS